MKCSGFSFIENYRTDLYCFCLANVANIRTCLLLRLSYCQLLNMLKVELIIRLYGGQSFTMSDIGGSS